MNDVDDDGKDAPSTEADASTSEPSGHIQSITNETVTEGGLTLSPPIAPANVSVRTTELQVQEAILQLMSDGKVWTNAQLKQRIPELLALTPGDRQRSPSRPREEKWEELVNNALTRIGRSNSLYARGLVENVGVGQHRRISVVHHEQELEE